MSKDEKLFQRIFDLFDPLVRDEWTVNHGDGFDMLRICAADPDDRKPVVMFRLDQGTLNRKELSFNVIRQGH